MLFWAITIDDIIHDVRKGRLLRDLTRHELDLIRQHKDSALDEVAHKLPDMLTTRIQHARGRKP